MATPVATERLFTVEEFEDLPTAYDEHGNEISYELVDGRLVPVTPPGFEHGRVCMRIARRLDQFVEAHALGAVVINDTGFVLRRAPDTMRGPDVAFVRTDHIPDGAMVRRGVRRAPDLAVEVVSPSDRARAVAKKVQDYLRAGAGLVWVLEPKRRLVTAHTPGAAARVYPPDSVLDGGDVLPGFAVPVAELFDRPPAAGPA